MAEQACTTYGYQPSEELHKIFTDYTRTHNQAVFDAYTPEMKAARHTHIITGLPDTYGRGRIVGDYRRVALYGIDALIKFKQEDFANCGDGTMTDDVIRLREEIARQISALKGMKKMAEAYGCDISQPAKNAKEACQWLYFGYLAAIKTQNGAAMSVGRISTFLDIYIQRDLDNGILTETQAQELIDHMVMKFRMVKFARIPSYNQLFSGDPVWATLEVGGIGMDGRSMVTKNCYRFLHTLENMGPAPEPNLTVLYSSALPESFKKYAAKVSIDTSSVQYENDDVMKPVWGDDYSICCCVSRHPDRQGDAVLRCPRQPCQVPAVRHQRRCGREEPRAVRPQLCPHHQRVPELRRGAAQVCPDAGLAGWPVRQRAEPDPVYARQILL